MAELEHRKADDPMETVTAALLEQGGVVVEDLIDAHTIEAIRSEVAFHVARADPKMRHLNPALDAFFGDKTRHVSGLAGKSRTFALEVMLHPTLLGVCDRILGPSCADYQLNLAHLMDRGPGAEQQWIHRDELVWVHLPKPHPEIQVACIVALEPFTAENGATRVVPGSHRWPVDRTPDDHEIAVAEMPAGAGVLYLGSTLHAGGANTTSDRQRQGVHLSYVVGWLRTEENNILATRPDVARSLPRRAQQLLGYGVHDAIRSAGGYLGMVELRDPADLLAEGRL